MRGSLSGAVTLAVLVANAAVVLADPITVTQDRRRTGAWLPEGRAAAEDNDTLAASAGPSLAGASTATLTSSFTNPAHWLGTGFIDVSTTTSEWSGANSTFEVDFTVTSPVTYTFDGSFTWLSLPSGCCAGGSFAALWVDVGRDRDGELIGSPLFSVGTPSSDGASHLTGLLMPGKYALSATTFSVHDAVGTATGTFTFSVDFAPAEPAPVPEPASLLLLGTGLAALVRSRRRAAHSENQRL